MTTSPFQRRFSIWLFTAVFLLFLPILLVGCFPGGKKDPAMGPVYYTLDYPPPAPSTPAGARAAICVEKFSAAPDYRSDALVYADRQYARQTYLFHRWRSTPGDMVSYLLARDLNFTDLFPAVSYNDCRPGTRYRVSGLVDEIFEENRENRWVSVLSLTITLMDQSKPDPNGSVLLQKTYRAEKNCAEKTPAAIAAAMSDAMQQISNQFIRDIKPLIVQ